MADTPTTSLPASSTAATTPTRTSSSSLSHVVQASLTAIASASASPRPGEGIELLPGNPVVNFILGLLVITASSVANSLGLNLMQFDHLRTVHLAPQQPPEYTRPLWLVGLGSYLASQLVGSTLALRYLRAEYCAPLSSSSLVFNFLFARWLIGTPVTKKDIQGTGLIILGVVLIVGLGSINSGLSTSITLERLYRLWARPAFLAYLVTQALALFLSWLFVLHLSLLAEERESDEDVIEGYLVKPPHRRFPKFQLTLTLHARYTALERFIASRLSSLVGRVPDARLRFYVGIGWAAVGGVMSGASLVFAKCLVMIGMGEGNVYWRPTPILTIVLLATTAVLQMIALNRGLKAYSSTVVVPVFYSGYTLLGFVNSMVFLDQFGAYSWVVLFFLGVAVGILLGGVVFLSSEKDPPAGHDATPRTEGSPSSPTPSAASALTARRGSRARAASASSSLTAGAVAVEEGWALFDVDDEERGGGADGLAEGGGKWELGDSDDDEDDDAEEEGKDGQKKRRVGENSRNPWEDDDGEAGEKDPIVRK